MFTTAPVLAGGLVCYTSCLQCPCLCDGELQGGEAPGAVFTASPRTEGEHKGYTSEGCAAPCSFRLHGLGRVWLQRAWAEISPDCSCFRGSGCRGFGLKSPHIAPVSEQIGACRNCWRGVRRECLSLALVTSDLLGPHFPGHSSLLQCPVVFCCPAAPDCAASCRCPC